MRILELFGGIGACTQALKRIGIEVEIADYVEIDKYAVASYNAINGTNFEPQDITEWDKDIEVDLIMHGSPCQDFSLAGKQAGGDENSGTRSSLMYETIRIVEKLKPKYVVWENVKNLLSKKHRHNFDNYLEKLEELGYNNYYQVLNAKDYGIPQNRERVYTISIRKDIDNKTFTFPEKEELKLRLKDMLEDNVEEKYYLSDKVVEKITYSNFAQEKARLQEKEYCDTLLARDYKDPKCIEVDREYGVFDSEEQKHQAGSVYSKEGLAPTLDTMQGGYRQPCIEIKNATKKGYLEAEEGDGVDISTRMEYHRGNVQKGLIQTLDCKGGEGHGVVVNDKPKVVGGFGKIGSTGQYHLQNRVYNDDVAVSVTTAFNPYYVEKKNMKEELCDYLIENNKVEENDMIRHSYTTYRKEKEFHTENSRNNNISATLTTRPDTLGVVVNTGIKRLDDMISDNKDIKENSFIDSYNNKIRNDGTTTTITARINDSNHFLVNNLRIRKLTPKECWRLMGFSDEAFEKAEKVNSNAQLYKQAGNSIVVDVLEKIFRNLLK